MSNQGMIVLDTPEQIAAYQALATLGALRVEAHTGLRHSRGSVLKIAQERYGVTARTKAAAVIELEGILRDREILR